MQTSCASHSPAGAAPQAARLAALGAANTIAAHAGLDLLWAPAVRERRDAIVELGSDGPLELERLAGSRVAAVLTSPLSADDDASAQLAALGIVAIPDAEWLEPHPAGRAEWIHLLGALVGREREAAATMREVTTGWQAVSATT